VHARLQVCVCMCTYTFISNGATIITSGENGEKLVAVRVVIAKILGLV
jgi:hypothetical protein